ncbi:aldose 1-epimerase [Phytohalomonas tamaricis]|uniref:aldose 1-epimerase n=1 Tax=Phytohalomonas tamaricis TaxID=2081032 RepID=UPI00131A3B77|nr:hypothetical protein [Phytohalomonas tamaricis]
MSFALHETHFGKWPALELHDDKGLRMRIALHGATLLDLYLPGPDGNLLRIIDGYRHAQELEVGGAARSALMAPFSNRIAHGRYEFNGQEHQLPVSKGEGNAIHGIVRDLDWTLANHHCDERSAAVTLTTAIGADTLPGYPFTVNCCCMFTLDEQGLEWSLVAENVGTTTAPFGCGWHPYFYPPGGNLEACRVVLPAREAVVADKTLIPLQGDKGRRTLNDHVLALNAHVLDACFTALAPDEDGLCRTRFEDSRAGLQLVVAQPYGAVHLFTGDTLAERARSSLAIEPTEFPPNAYNMPELAEQITLAPGAVRRFGAKVTLEALTS